MAIHGVPLQDRGPILTVDDQNAGGIGFLSVSDGLKPDVNDCHSRAGWDDQIFYITYECEW